VSKLSNTFYGGFKYHGKVVLAHRVAYIFTHGDASLPDDVNLLHDCDTPGCVNPSHLFKGDQGKNMRQCVDRGRNFVPPPNPNPPKGEDIGNSKLSNADVNKILKLLAGRRKYQKCHPTQKEIAKQFGVSINTVTNIKMGATWNHLSGKKRPSVAVQA
jgi:DNA-binding XRE family transcriptional regulator